MNVRVSEFRDQIRHLERVIHVDAKACVGDKEKQYCVRVAKSVGSALINMECKTAKEQDLMDKERILDQSFHFIYNNSPEYHKEV